MKTPNERALMFPHSKVLSEKFAEFRALAASSKQAPVQESAPLKGKAVIVPEKAPAVVVKKTGITQFKSALSEMIKRRHD